MLPSFGLKTIIFLKKYWDEYHIRVNADTIYLNQFIKYAREGKFKGLNNEKLKEFGSKQKFYPGSYPEFFQESKALIETIPRIRNMGYSLSIIS